MSWPFLSRGAVWFGVAYLGNEQIEVAEGTYYRQQQ